jgi:transcription elongation factor Elf1
MECPNCRKETMNATSASYKKRKLTIMLTCSACWHIKYLEFNTTDHFEIKNSSLRLIEPG